MDTISDNTNGGRSTSDGAESAAVESAGCIDGPRNGPGIASEGVSPCSPPSLTISHDTLRAAFEEHRRETRETRELRYARPTSKEAAQACDAVVVETAMVDAHEAVVAGICAARIRAMVKP